MGFLLLVVRHSTRYVVSVLAGSKSMRCERATAAKLMVLYCNVLTGCEQRSAMQRDAARLDTLHRAQRPVSISVARIDSAMDEEQLIRLVETRSYLYDTSSFHYKNVNKMAAAWREIARELKVSGKLCFCVFCPDAKLLTVS